jgi:hypothetical protein
VGAGQILRFRVASNLAGFYPPEPLPATYRLHHNDVHRSSITLTYVESAQPR